jgi:hypothetical protein
MRLYRNAALLLAGTIILAYFLSFTHGGLGTYFSRDDMLNIAFLHGYGRVPLPVLAAEAVAVFTPEYRPVGGAYYRTLYALFGLAPLPFRVAFFALLIVNLGLACLWIWRLTGERSTALMSVVVFSFHAALADLYYNDGTVYDVLCLFFVLVLLCLYTRIRRRGRFAGPGETFLLALLGGAALGNKEMAVTLPVVLLACELLLDFRPKDIWRRARPILVVGLVMLLAIVVKLYTPNQMSINPMYQPRCESGFIAHAYLHYYRQLLFAPNLTGLGLAGLLLAALALALVLRRRAMLFALLFANVTLLPVCVIPPRGGFVWYMPLLGCALYVGSALSRLSEWLIATLALRARSERFRKLAPMSVQSVLFGCLIGASYLIQSQHSAGVGDFWKPQQTDLKILWRDIKAAAPSLPSGSRILLETDPFREIDWTPMFLLRLGYGDPTLWLDRMMHVGPDFRPDDLSIYALRLRYNGAGYDVQTHPTPAADPVRLLIEPQTVRRGHNMRVRLPVAFASCPIDVAYRMPDDELARAGIWYSWATLDGSGAGTGRVDQDAERGSIVIDRVRACHRDWAPAQGSFLLVP